MCIARQAAREATLRANQVRRGGGEEEEEEEQEQEQEEEEEEEIVHYDDFGEPIRTKKAMAEMQKKAETQIAQRRRLSEEFFRARGGTAAIWK